MQPLFIYLFIYFLLLINLGLDIVLKKSLAVAQQLEHVG